MDREDEEIQPDKHFASDDTEEKVGAEEGERDGPKKACTTGVGQCFNLAHDT